MTSDSKQQSFKRRQILKTGASTGLITAGFAGCTGENNQTPTEGDTATGGGDSQTSNYPDTLSLGLGAPLSGPAATIGNKFVNGIKAALDEEGINSIEGTDITMELVSEDSGCSSDGGINAARKLIKQKNVDTFFSVCSPGTLASMPITREENTMHVTSSLAKETTQKGHSTLLRTGFRADWISANVGRFAYERGLRRMASLNVDNAYGNSYAEGFKRGFEGAGGTIVQSDSYSYGTSSFDQYLSKYENIANLDGVMEVGYSQHHLSFIPAFRKRLTEKTLVSATDANDPGIVQQIGLKNYYSGGGTIGARLISNNDMAQRFTQRYMALSGRPAADRFGAWGWNYVNMVKRGIELAGVEEVLTNGISKSDDNNESLNIVNELKDATDLSMVWGDNVAFNKKGDMYFDTNHGIYTRNGFEVKKKIPIREGRP